MQKRIVQFLISLLFIAAILVTGCTSSGSISAPVTTPAPTMAAAVSITTTDAPVQTAAPVSVVTTPAATITTTAAPVPNVTLIQRDNPAMLNLQFTKNYLITRMDNCPFIEAFPSIGKDPAYGLSKTPKKIIALSAPEWRVFLRNYMEGRNEASKSVGVSRCEGAVVNPWWNFVEVSAKVSPTNARPANYTVSLDVRSQGKVIAQFNTTEFLTLGETTEFISYIPLQTNDMDFFDSVEVTYTKLPN